MRMADEAEDVLKELEDYHEKAKKKIEKIEQPKEVKKDKPKEAIIKEKMSETRGVSEHARKSSISDNPIEIKAEKKVKEEKKQEKKMAEEREITIKIRVNPLVIERIAYITIILILIYFAFFKSISINIGLPSFGSLFGSKGNVSITTPTESETTADEADTTSETAEEEETTETTATETSETTTTTTASGKIDAELVFDNGNIVVSGTHPGVKVTSITYKIRNKGDDLYSRVDVFWYDENDEPTIKSKVRATYKLKVGTGKVASKTITSFKGTYLSSINKEETFVLKLFNDKTGNKVDEKTVIFTSP